MSESHRFLETLTIVLLMAAGATVLFQRLKQPIVLGYLLAGMIIGPNIPVPVEADHGVVESLSELGVILLMFSLGIEFSFRKLLRVGATAGIVALIETSFMVWLGYLVTRSLGWSPLESFYGGAMVAISSTTIIVKAFAEQRMREPFTQIVLGVLIFEDLVAILLITVLTAVSTGEKLDARALAWTGGRLALFLGLAVIVGLAIAPRLLRMIVGLRRPETTVVASVGLAFGFALVAMLCNYSVALGAFIAGGIVALSGVDHTIQRLVEPVRDIFAAVFFVSVGMLIDPAQIAEHWVAVLALVATVILGKTVSVSAATFLTGQPIETAVKAGLSQTQIGEFSFIIAGVGIATGATREFLYPVAVAVSALTTLSTPLLIRSGAPVAKLIDRKLPRPLQTFAALYGAWIEQLRIGVTYRGEPTRLRTLIRWLAADAMLVAAITIAGATQFPRLDEFVRRWSGLRPEAGRNLAIGLIAAATIPFWIGMIRTTRSLGLELADRALPPPQPGKVDLANSARRLFVVTLQLTIAVLVGAPLVAITQPFLPLPHAGGAALFAVVGLALVPLWRRATNLQGHVTAASQLIAETLSRKRATTRSLLAIRCRIFRPPWPERSIRPRACCSASAHARMPRSCPTRRRRANRWPSSTSADSPGPRCWRSGAATTRSAFPMESNALPRATIWCWPALKKRSKPPSRCSRRRQRRKQRETSRDRLRPAAYFSTLLGRSELPPGRDRLAQNLGHGANLADQFGILLGQERLRTVGHRLFRTIMHFDMHAIGPGRHSGQRASRNQIGSAGRMARVDDNRQVRERLGRRHGRHVEQVARR